MCDYQGCNVAAKFAIKLLVPCRDEPIGTYQPLYIVIPMQLCRTHFKLINPQELLGAPAGDGVTVRDLFVKAAGDIPLAPERAWVDKVSLLSEEWRELVMEKGPLSPQVAEGSRRLQ